MNKLKKYLNIKKKFFLSSERNIDEKLKNFLYLSFVPKLIDPPLIKTPSNIVFVTSVLPSFIANPLVLLNLIVISLSDPIPFLSIS